MTTRKRAARTAGGTLRLVAVRRVSRKNGRGDNGKAFLSPQQQDDLMFGFERNRDGAQIVASVDETDSVSGRTTERTGLAKAMEMIRDGQADGIIVAKADRFCRNTLEGLLAIRELRESGGTFIAVQEGIDSWDPRDAMGKLFLTIVLALAEWQYDTLTNGWADVVERQIAAGIANCCPWGYMRCNGGTHAPGCEGDGHELHRRLIPDPERAPWVVRMFERRAQGQSWTAIADHLNAKGVAPAGGGAWSYTSVRNIVSGPQCRTYLGELRSGENVNPTAHAAIVPRDLWERANVRQATAKRNALEYPLHGLVRCANCGSRMRGNTQHDRYGEATRYYRCRGRFSWGICTHPARVNADVLEALVFEQFERDYVHHGRWTATESNDALDAAVARHRDAVAGFDAWQVDPTTLRMRQVMGESSYQRTMTAYLDDIEDAAAAVAAAEGDLLGRRLPASLAQVWPEMEDEDRRALLALIYPVIAVRPALRPGRWDDEPVAGRVRAFKANEVAALGPLPGRGAGAELRPILFAAAVA